MPERSVFTKAALKVANDYKRAIEAKAPHATPYMMEKVRGPQAMERFAQMSPEEREKLIARVGMGPLREIIKRNRNA